MNGKNRKQTPRLTQLAGLFAAPPPGFYRQAQLHIAQGGPVELTGCRRVLDFTQDRCRVELHRGILTFSGDELRIVSLSGGRLILRGLLLRIDFSQGGEEKP